MRYSVLITLLFLLPAVALTLYAHPAADDFLISHTARDWGSYTTVVGFYKCWSARYTSIFLMSVNPLVFGWFVGYKIVPLLLVGGLFFGIRKFSAGLLGNISASGGGLFASGFLLVYLYSMPDMPGGLYYLGGSLFYQPCNIFLAVLIGSLLINLPPSSLKSLPLTGWLHGGFQGILLVLMAGANEIGMMLGLAVTGMGLLCGLLLDKKNSSGWILLLLVSAICTFIIVKSPATSYRMEAAGGFGRSLSEVVLLSFDGMCKALLQWFSAPALVLFPVFVYFIFRGANLTQTPIPKNLRIYFSLLTFLLFYFCFVPSFLGEGLLQAHTENMLLFIFMLLICINMRIWIPAGTAPLQAERVKKNLPLFLLLVAGSPGFLQAVADLYSGDAAAFSAERDARHHLMLETPGDTVRIPPLRHKPKSLFAGDIGDFPAPWYDNHFAAMYGKKWVELRKDKEIMK